MTTRVRLKDYEPNRDGIAALAVGPEIRTAITHLGHQAKLFAISISPGDADSDGDGHYAASFEVEVEVIPDIPFRIKAKWAPMARWAATLVNQSPHAIIVEVGASKTPEYRVLRKTLEWMKLAGDQ